MVKQFELWIADLNPQSGTESGKNRPVLIIQTNFLNKGLHSSTIVCPLTTNIQVKAELLRIHLSKGEANLVQDCDIIIDQIRAIDNKKLVEKLGDLPQDLISVVKENLSIVLDLQV